MTLECASDKDFPEKFSQTDLDRMGRFLADAAGEFSQHSCNDFTCMATAENKALFTKIIHWQAEQDGEDADPQLLDYVAKVQSEHEKIFTYDNWAMGYFAQRCEVLSKTPSGAPELSPAELNLITELFDVMVDFREIDRDDHGITVDYTLTPTDDNKRFIAKVIKHEGAADWGAAVDGIMNSDEEISVLDIAIMRYYADRCKELATSN